MTSGTRSTGRRNGSTRSTASAAKSAKFRDRPADLESLVQPLRLGLEGTDAALQEHVTLLGEQIAALSRESAPREVLDAVAANAARIDRLEEESSAALAACASSAPGVS